MKRKITYAFCFVATAMIITSCGGSEESSDGKSETNEDVTEETIVRPEPETVISGSSVLMEHGTKNPQSNYENGYDCNYTIVEYTKNVDLSTVSFKEYYEPSDDQQLVHVVIEAEIVSLTNRNSQEPLDQFDLFLEEGGEEYQPDHHFTEEFTVGIATIGDLEINQKGKMEFYYRVPLDADFSTAFLELYRGSDYEPLIISLNK